MSSPTKLDTLRIKKNDTVNAITATLKTSAGVPVDLTGCTVVFRMVSRDLTIERNGAAVIVGSPDNGQVSYSTTGPDTAVTGGYYVNWVVTFSDATVARFPSDTFQWLEILSDLP